MAFVLTIIAVALILFAAEYLARKTKMHAELTRKFVHMMVGIFVAFWPFFLTWKEIEMLSIGFFVVILLSIRYTIFTAIHTTPRRAVGEISFAMVIGFLALLSSSKYIFMASMLCLGIGDAMAAIIGLLKGDNNQYKVFGKTKSIAGTSAFFVCAVLVMVLYVALSDSNGGFMTLVLVPLLATATENVAVNGTDNLIMPLLIALVLGGSS